jgi:hypothetical protein
MISETIPQLQSLTAEEKLILSNELWNEAQESMQPAGGPDSALVATLRQRLREYDRERDEYLAGQK